MAAICLREILALHRREPDGGPSDPAPPMGFLLLGPFARILSPPRPRLRPIPKIIFAASVKSFEDLVHDLGGAQGRIARTRTRTTAQEIVHDRLNERLLDVRGGRAFDDLYARERLQ